MEIDITQFFTTATAKDYSASVAEIGADATRETWHAAVTDSAQYALLPTDDHREEFRRYVRTFGAWDEAEILAWSDEELNALLLQMIAGDIREGGLDVEEPDWEAYQEQSEAGQVSGRLFNGEDGRVYYYVGD